MGEQVVSEGDTVEVGALIARIEEGGAAPAKEKTEEPPAKKADASVNPAGPGETPTPKEDETAPHPEEHPDMALTLSPAVRRVVLEHGLDPSKIKGTGKDGRLTKDDVLAAAKAEKAAKAAPAEAPQPARPAVAGERRSDESRVGKEGGRTYGYRWWAAHY